MASRFPKDRFDEAPRDGARVGAHRAPFGRGHRWVWFGWSVLAVAVLVAAGVFGLLVIDGKISTDDLFAPSGSPTESAPPSPTPTVVATLDPDATVLVLNGTTVQGAGSSVTDALSSDGWHVDPPVNADENDVETTVVYYASDDDEGAALGVVESLRPFVSDVRVVRSDHFAETGAALAVVLGADLSLPNE